jgi:hypothetical protein
LTVYKQKPLPLVTWRRKMVINNVKSPQGCHRFSFPQNTGIEGDIIVRYKLYQN